MLGDTIERITKFTGIKPVIKRLVKNCKCEKRKKILNNEDLLINKLLYKK
jgi:hypothetical protein